MTQATKVKWRREKKEIVANSREDAQNYMKLIAGVLKWEVLGFVGLHEVEPGLWEAEMLVLEPQEE